MKTDTPETDEIQGHDKAWELHFVTPLAKEMQKRGVKTLIITFTEKGRAAYELVPYNEDTAT